MAFVLVHGGAHGAWCWERMVPFLDGEVLAVDLPGRGAHPVDDLSSVTVADFVSSCVADIEAFGHDDLVLVGHSMAGLTLPGVTTALADRVRHQIYVSCSVPPEGGSILDTLIPEVRVYVESQPPGPPSVMPEEMARFMFCNDMDEPTARFVLDGLCPEAPGITAERVSRAAMPSHIRRSWVKLLQDQVLPPAKQDEFITNLGGVNEIVELDSGHNAMVSRPRELAAILNKLAKRPT